MRTKFNIILVVTLLLFLSGTSYAQHETVISLLQSDKRLADQYFKKQDYRNALALYEDSYRRKSKDTDTRIKMARCHFYLKQYNEAVEHYEKVSSSPSYLSNRDLYYFAEAYASTGKARDAVRILGFVTERSPNDTIAANKIWRLSNIQYLYEDSVHYAVQPLTQLNTTASEIFVGEADGSIYFISDRPEVRLIETIDASGSNFYNIYAAAKLADSIGAGGRRFGRPSILSSAFETRTHAGTASFYSKGKKVVYASAGNTSRKNGHRTLQLRFLEKTNNGWRISEEFPFNSDDYSISDPSISGDGKVLYFSSDMPGGIGGKDIYRCLKIDGKWTKPENMQFINSPFDEIAPYNHLGKTLYFASNGHPGMGGFDIFKIDYRLDYWSEVYNLGYPVNSVADDFGFAVDSVGTNGYLSSNRANGGLDDDMYHVMINVQSYPITIAGLVRIKDTSLSEGSESVPFANAKFQLLDNARNTVVYESMTNDIGAVNISIPYFSKFKIRIIGPDDEVHVASFDIPRNRKVDERYEIVLVRDLYNSPAPLGPQNQIR